MTVTWHVDDLKILHKSKWEITKIIKCLARIYGDIMVKRENQQEYLEITESQNKLES